MKWSRYSNAGVFLVVYLVTVMIDPFPSIDIVRLLSVVPSELTDDSSLSTSMSNMPEGTRRGLRLNWANLPPLSEIAIKLQNLQNDCSLPFKKFIWRTNGIGSELHVWGNHLWDSLSQSRRLRTSTSWAWTDLDACDGNSSWLCYFPAVESRCPTRDDQDKGDLWVEMCNKPSTCHDNYSIGEFRAAATEFVFSSVSQVVIREAERQLHKVFGDEGVPDNLILVHIRWGDKVVEAVNQPIENVTTTIERMIKEHELDSIHILLCTEDPKAVALFRKAAPPSWTIYLDYFLTEYLEYRKGDHVYNQATTVSSELKGKPGLWALGSLLVAMEAKYYVLTTTSNWSRLMNELRKNVVNPRCGNCTYLIDLQEGEC